MSALYNAVVKAARPRRPAIRGHNEYRRRHDRALWHCRADPLQKHDELGIANNTIVLYATDNGPHTNSRPDGAMIPFRGEKGTNREGAFRVAAMVRWLG